LGVGVSNALQAIQAGAEIIDGSSMGLGAGSGNAALESIVVNYRRSNPEALQLPRFLEMSQLVETSCTQYLPRTTSVSIQSGDAGVFSGFAPQVKLLSAEFGISQEDLWQELGRRRLVAGQESMIREIAQDLMNL
jgi:4-hydroxy 2-oxovalerate aldolase